jgi:hypothetical protein
MASAKALRHGEMASAKALKHGEMASAKALKHGEMASAKALRQDHSMCWGAARGLCVSSRGHSGDVAGDQNKKRHAGLAEQSCREGQCTF